MSDIIEFLNARIDEDEHIALAARGSITPRAGDAAIWSVDASHSDSAGVSAGGSLQDCGFGLRIHDEVTIVYDEGLPTVEVATHMAHHDPARVLREVQAKRAIVKSAELWSTAAFPDYDGGYASAMDDAVQELAAAYNDHPDYQESWKP